MTENFNATPHKRYNILTGEWVLVSPHRTNRTWQGKKEVTSEKEKIAHDPNCYLCAKNIRINGEVNPDYKNIFVLANYLYTLLLDSHKKTQQ
ncbi:hypothetical protein SB49_02815 [Sediminicola sp. YIK13]|uniref:hypothetical protein n=1 Tax=Sediminicola sp. YIK13 TaxID=1453352 RepID=UPI000720F899|nr:hypothetical protein [Sediminicola sp. YIK13]ALM06852.1 hypothetical protein SB49_02815 [Sediminicola sp. YIK13]